ncbi:PLP-dependent aminotransferase family protein [Microbacteriaceae bacterium VKM Ac-2854]|nr:PLP-dependent aminotransferase family protein [Microbacteriaceae bacterium VKM Ac-2854]
MKHDSSGGRLVETLRATAASMSVGERMPSTRLLMQRHAVSPVTVAAAVAALVADGTLVTEHGRGTFVAPRLRDAGRDASWQDEVLGPARFDASPVLALSVDAVAPLLVLNAGYLDEELQPRAALTAAATRAMRRPHAWAKAPLAGLPELRALFATPLGLPEGDVVIIPGTQAGLAAAFRALGRDTVLVEQPSYPGALVAARAAGLAPHPVATDAQGLLPDALDAALAATGSRLVYAQPCVANPSGATLAADRRAAVLEILARRGAFLIEDDWARDLVFDAHAPRPLAAEDPHGHVVYLRSLTKPVAPSLRVGALVARGLARRRILEVRSAEDFFVARPMQEVAIELLGSSAWPRHLRHVHAALRARRTALLGALAGTRLTVESVPIGGLHLWARLPEGVAAPAATRRAAAAAVVVGDGTAFFTGRAPMERLRLSFGAADEATLVEGVHRGLSTL